MSATTVSPRATTVSPRSAAALAVLLVGVLEAALVARQVLPEQYLRDDGHLRSVMAGGTVDSAESFREVAALYVATGLDAVPPVAALVTVGLDVALVLLAVRVARPGVLRTGDLAVIGAVLAPALLYLAQYTKEIATLGVVAVVLALPAGRGPRSQAATDLAVVAACLVYGALLRPYWLLVAGLYLVWRVVLPRTSSAVALLAVPAVAYAALQPVFRAVLGHGLQGARDWSNAERAGTDVASLITSIAPDATGIRGVGAALLSLVRQVVPWGLYLSGSPAHLVAAIAITGVWVLTLLPVLRGRLLRRAPGHAPDPATVTARRAAALLLAVVCVQALFEPDHGSALKHLTPLLPLVLVVHLHRRAS